jgi:hypothetical protein
MSELLCARVGSLSEHWNVKRMIGDSRRRALASVNRELGRLDWEIGRVIVAQQGETRTVSRHDQLAGVVERPSPAVPEYPSKLAAAWRESAHPDASPILATLWRELSPEREGKGVRRVPRRSGRSTGRSGISRSSCRGCVSRGEADR